MAPYIMTTVTNSFQLILCSVTTFTQLTGCPYPFLCGAYGHLLCVGAGCVQVRVSYIPPWQALVQRCLISSTLWASFSCPIIRICKGPEGTGSGLEDSCLCWSKLGPVFSINSGVQSLPCLELCSLLALTSWELTHVLLPWQLLNEPLGEWSHFFCKRLARDSRTGCPTKGVPSKGRSSKRGMTRGEVSVG